MLFCILQVLLENKKIRLWWKRESSIRKDCTKHLFNRQHLSRHENLLHSESIEKYSCICSKEFSKDALNRHKKKCNVMDGCYARSTLCSHLSMLHGAHFVLFTQKNSISLGD